MKKTILYRSWQLFNIPSNGLAAQLIFLPHLILIVVFYNGLQKPTLSEALSTFTVDEHYADGAFQNTISAPKTTFIPTSITPEDHITQELLMQMNG